MAGAAVDLGPGRRWSGRSPAVRFALERIQGLLLLAAFVGVWQLIVSVSDISPLLFPAPGAVFTELGEIWESGLLMTALGETTYPLAVGFALGVTGGLLFGILIGLSPKADAVTHPYMWGLFTTPDIAFVPVVIIWFGYENTTKILMVFLGVAIPMAIAVRDGARTLDESTMRAAVSFCANRTDLLTKVVVPGILPSVANGVRNGISKGFTGVLVVEMTVGSSGLGRQVMYAMIQFDMPRMFAFIVVLVALAIALIMVSKRFELFASRWREQVSL
jgi:ABC-type nitrate/sulfonate/bicarbonate transport system permease component